MTADPNPPMTMLERLTEIARKHRLLDDDHPTFEIRGRDSLDFLDVSVRAIGQALDEAYRTGAKLAIDKMERKLKEIIR